MQCPRHGVKQIAIPWAEPGNQFTLLFERLAIDFLRECSVTGAAALLRITWDEAWGIKERAVRRGLARRTAEPIPHLGIDEKAITKGHRYLTVVADLDRHRVLFLHDDRTTESLDAFWPTCTPAQLDSIEAVAMDMRDPYVQSVSAHVPHGAGKIVFDKFHIVISENAAPVKPPFEGPDNLLSAPAGHICACFRCDEAVKDREASRRPGP